MNLYREKLVDVELPVHVMTVLQKNIAPIVGHHVHMFSVRQSIESQMRALALDAYCQGAVDGERVARMPRP